jgi:outer membrane lipoprotein-sorting protein
MSKGANKVALVLILAVLPLLVVGGVIAAGQEVIDSTDAFVSKLEEEYGKIANFSARLSLSGMEPPVSIRVLAVSEPRILRVEYLSPDRMQGQFFLLKGDYLYQYMPGRNLIIKKDLKGSDLPVEAANLTPDYLLKLVRSDDLEVKLIGTPVPFGFDSLFGDYVLEVIPKSDAYQFSRQVIQFDSDDLLPRELITYFGEKDRDTVYTSVEEVRTNMGLEMEEVKALPKDAEVIED